MADIRQQYLQDHAALVARQQAMAQAPSMLSSVGNGIMSLFGGTSPYAVGPAPSATGPTNAADMALSPGVVQSQAPMVHNVADNTTDKSPASMPDAPSYIGDMTNANAKPSPKAPAAQHDVMASPMLAPTQPTGIASLPTVQSDPGAAQRDMSMTGPQFAADNAYAVPQAAAQVANPQFPTNANDYTLGQKINSTLFTADDPYQQARERAAAGRPSLDHAPMPPQGSPQGPLPPVGAGPTGQAAPMPSPVVTPATAATVDPQQQALADIMQQKALINSIYPERPVDNSAQDKADAELEKDRSRSSSEAMLALMAGIAQGSGGIWTGVGRGLAGAGQAYEDGFNRYQKALQNKADRVKSNNDTAYNDQVGRTDAAVKLYAQQQSLTKDANSLARQQFKDKQDDIDKYFTEKLHTQKGTDMNPPDEAAISQTMRLWQLSKHNNSIINSEDDLTK